MSHSNSPLMTIKNELLHGAVVKGELPTVRRLLDRHKADINTKNSNGLSVLQLSLLNGHTKLSEYLIQKGVDILSTDAYGYTALHDAALKEEAALVRKLISKGLSPLVTTQKGEMVIDVAGSVQMEKLLCEEMCHVGEVQLAKEYTVYLGLDQEGTDKRAHSSRGCNHYFSKDQHDHQGSHWIFHASSPKHESKNSKNSKNVLKTESQASENLRTHSSRVHPSAKDADLAQYPISNVTNHHGTAVGSHPNCGKQNHSNAKDEEVSESPSSNSYKEPAKEQQQAIILATPEVSKTEAESDTSASNIVGSSPKEESPLPAVSPSPPSLGDYYLSLQPVGNTIQPPLRESNRKSSNPSPRLLREGTAIKSLYQHNSFQLQIGLSLHSQDIGSSLDREDSAATTTVGSSPGQASSTSSTFDPSNSLDSSLPISPAVVRRRQKTATHPGLGNWSPVELKKKSRSPRITSLQQKRILQKTVSFADFPMTRSKAMFVGQTSRTSSNSCGDISAGAAEAEDVTTQKGTAETSATATTRTKAEYRLSLPADIMEHFIQKQESGKRTLKSAKSVSDTDGVFDAGIRALSMKPRKSIIALPKRRTTIADIGNRRRSVTFQPEILLHEIVTDGDVKAVSEMLESGMIQDVNKMIPSGLTALHQSAIDGNLECAKALVAKGADVNCTDCESWTPLHAAAMNGSAEFVRFLLASGANASLKNDAGETAYDISKSRPIRKMLLHAMNDKNLDGDDFSDGEYSGEEEEEEYSHAESDSDDDDDDLENESLFESNLEEKKSLKERLGLTHTSALNNLPGNSTSPSPDMDSVFSSNTQVQLSQERELTDSTSSYGSMFEPEVGSRKPQPPDEHSSMSKNCESDTDKISESGISTMEGSSDCSHRSRVLSSEDEGITLDSDLDPDSVDYKFQEACLYCNVDMALKLLKHKCEINVDRVNRASGITALHHSVLEENFALVQHLVKDFEADIHARDIDGWTPLHAASAVGNIQIAQFLLDRGAKASCLNNQCEFPVDVAEDEAMEKLLKNTMLGHTSGNSLKR